MGESFDLFRFSRIARKRNQLGRESLTAEERDYYHGCLKAMRPMLKRLSEWANNPANQEGFAAYEQMSAQDQERFADWTPEQFLVFLPLLEDEPDEDDLQVL